MRKLILLFVIFLSAVILGTYLNYPIENMNGSLTHAFDNGVNKKNYEACLACADNVDNKKCTVLTANGEVQCGICNLNHISHNTPKELCLNSWDDEPRGFGCEHGFGTPNTPPPKKGCHKDPPHNPIPSDDEVWTADKCLNHFKETIRLDNGAYKLCDRLTESICDNNCGDYCKWDIDDDYEGMCKLKNEYKGYT